MKFYSRIFILILLFVLSCGQGPSDKNSHVQKEESIEGNYTGNFVPLNMPKVWDPKGIAKLSIIQDEFHLVVAIRDITSARHYQSLHLVKNCPDDRADKNFDGYIDAGELFRSAGKIVIPLDGDLETQRSGSGIFPSGNYRYDHTVSYSKLLSDLQAVDENPSDDIVKMRKADLPSGKLAVIVYGVPSDYEIPSTVHGRKGMSIQESLPIACASLKQSRQIPEEPDISNPVPHRDPDPQPVENPTPPPVEETHTPTWRQRIGNVWRRAWCRIRRCEPAGTFSTAHHSA